MVRQFPFAYKVYLFLSKSSLHRQSKRIVLLATDGNKKRNNAEDLYVLNSRVPSIESWKNSAALIEKSITSKTLKLFSESSQNINNVDVADCNPVVTVLVSLYKSELYLDTFLHNVIEQTYFSKSEIVIISVEPSDTEKILLDNFQSRYGNARILFVNSRISIYEAWNLAIRNSVAEFITNMNVDDLRRSDSLELQAKALISQPNVDIVYQDFYFTLDRNISWGFIQQMGFVSDLPPVSILDQIWFGMNPPHNAPMWRRQLHNEIGFFDASLKSAGDYDFWIRCSLNKRIFMKMQEIHVAYYVNPLGMSTSALGPSETEEVMIQKKYIDRVSELPNFKNLSISFADSPWIYAERFTQNFLDSKLTLRRHDEN
jgi:glycosyltransferase involved in cell wall biosynthesis